MTLAGDDVAFDPERRSASIQESDAESDNANSVPLMLAC